MLAFELSLREALRDGAISRGLDVSEEEVRYAETHAAQVRHLVHQTGDATLIRMLRDMPEECLGRLRHILALSDSEPPA